VNPRAWFMKATKHRSLNMLRDRREAPMADAELPVGPRYDPDPTEAEALAEVRSTLWALPESQHHAFVLRHWSGLSQDEIADVLGTTPGAVESLLVRARTTLLEDRQQGAECSGVRRRLVQALAPIGRQQAHIDRCRRCRTAQTRLLRAAEFATAFTLVPRPYVAHALASVVPGFSAPAVATTTAAGAAGAGAGGGAGVATAGAATKLALATKIALVTTTAVVALGAAHPVRRAVEKVVLGGPAASSASGTHRATPARADGTARGVTPPGTPTTGQPAHGSPRAHPPHGGNGNGNGNGKGKANGQGSGTGRSAPGANGKAKGKPATAGSAGKSATAGSNGKALGKAATATGKAKGKPTTAGAATPGGSSPPAGHGNGKGNGKS
jgi:hypothetical protein